MSVHTDIPQNYSLSRLISDRLGFVTHTLIHHTGMSSVYTAHDRNTAEQVIVKVTNALHPEQVMMITGQLPEQNGFIMVDPESILAKFYLPVDAPKRSVFDKLRGRSQPTTAEAYRKLQAATSEDHDPAYRAFREALALLALNDHDHIVKLKHFFIVNSGGDYYPVLVEEYAGEMNLGEVILEVAGDRGKLLELLPQTIGIADAIDYAHSDKIIDGRRFFGVINRDLKPGNVAVGNNGHLRLLDFGAVYHNLKDTMKGAYGTLAYFAPELFKGKLASEASDIYSFSVILYELIKGESFISTTDLTFNNFMSTYEEASPLNAIEVQLKNALPQVPQGNTLRLAQLFYFNLATNPEERVSSAKLFAQMVNYLIFGPQDQFMDLIVDYSLEIRLAKNKARLLNLQSSIDQFITQHSDHAKRIIRSLFTASEAAQISDKSLFDALGSMLNYGPVIGRNENGIKIRLALMQD